MSAAIDPETIGAVILAGGRGSRMGGADKGLQQLKGRALAWHALQRLQTQIGGAPALIGINANRNLVDYSVWGHPVWVDEVAGFAGPLAGFDTALLQCQQHTPPLPYLLTVPCDSPNFPLDLLSRLAFALADHGADIAVACGTDADRQGSPVLRVQPVFCLMRTQLRANLNNYLAQGGRKIADWTAQLATVQVAFNIPGDDPLAFFNTNTAEQLQQLEDAPQL